MNTLYDKFLKRLQEISEYEWDNYCLRIHEEFTGPNGKQNGVRQGETALEAIARNMVETMTTNAPPDAIYQDFTTNCRAVIALANDEAGSVNATKIEAHHLLIAIAKEGNSVAAKFIAKHLNIYIQRLSGYAYEYHPFRSKQLASTAAIFHRAIDLACSSQVPTDTHHLFLALLTIGTTEGQHNEICGLLSYVSIVNDGTARIAPDQILPAYWEYYKQQSG